MLTLCPMTPRSSPGERSGLCRTQRNRSAVGGSDRSGPGSVGVVVLSRISVICGMGVLRMTDLVVCPAGPCLICNGEGVVKVENLQRAHELPPVGAGWEPTLWEPSLCSGCEGAAAAVTLCPCGCGAMVCDDCAAGLAVTDATLTALWQMATQDWESERHG